MTTRLRAHFDGKSLVPLEAVDLPRDQVLDVEVHSVPASITPGSPQAIIRALQTLTPIPREDLEEIGRLLGQNWAA